MESEFTKIDIKTWSMAQAFHYYTQMAPTTYTIDISIDVTALRKVVKEKEYKFFPVYLYIVTKAVISREELCMAVREGELGYWNCLNPVYPQLHSDNNTTSLLWTEYNDSFKEFYQNYIEDVKKYGNDHGILTSKGAPPSNGYIVSCIPWFTFRSFSLHNHGIKDYFFPSFESGAFTKYDDKIHMPLSITAHHAVTEGYHIKLFLDKLQYLASNPEEWIES